MSINAPHIFVLFTSFVLLFSTSSGAITLEKGKWKFKAKSNSSPETETTIECIKTATYDPVKEMTEDGHCTVSDKKETVNSVSWKMQCGRGGGMPPMQGEGKFTSKGDTVSGKMTMSFGSMVMTHHYDGEKISSKCDE